MPSFTALKNTVITLELLRKIIFLPHEVRGIQAGKDCICSSLDFICHKNTDFLINQKTGYISIFLHNNLYLFATVYKKVHSDEG